jgi:hypothetical protein
MYTTYNLPHLLLESQKHKSNEKAATSSSLRQFLKKRDDPSIVVHPSIQAR